MQEILLPYSTSQDSLTSSTSFSKQQTGPPQGFVIVQLRLCAQR